MSFCLLLFFHGTSIAIIYKLARTHSSKEVASRIVRIVVFRVVKSAISRYLLLLLFLITLTMPMNDNLKP